MGLDALDLVLRTEQHFGIEFPEESYAELRTVDDLCQIVARLTGRPYQPAADPREPLEQAICAAVLATIDARPEAVTREWPLRGLPDQLRAGFAEHLATEIGGHRLRLRWPWTISLVVALGLTAFWGWRLWQLGNLGGVAALLVGPLALLIAMITLSLWETLPQRFPRWATEFPPGVRTVADLADHLGRTDAAAYRWAVGTPEQPLFSEIRPLVRDALGLADAQITPYSRFVEDLQMG